MTDPVADPAPARRLHVLHLVGSPVDEFHADLSRLYARDALTSLADPDRYRTTVVHVGPDGRWAFLQDVASGADLDRLAGAPTLDRAGALAHLAGLGVDVALPQMFCRPGMTTYRALLELLDLPFVGNTAEAMALGAHKGRARAVVAAAGVPVPEGELLAPTDEPALAPPVVVKPAAADNSHGVTLVRTAEQYDAALAAAREVAGPDGEVLVERYVELGREVRCGVLETDDGLVALPLEEYAVDADRKPIRDAADKLARTDDGDLRLVAKDVEHAWVLPLDDPATATVHAAAVAAHRALGCRDYGLFDFRIDPEGRPWFLEAGLYCSFARQSVVAVMADAAGIPLAELFADAAGRAVRRGAGGGAGGGVGGRVGGRVGPA